MARTTGNLNALSVGRLKKPGVYGDGGGLYLRVRSKEARFWVLRYMLGGRAREMGLGPYPVISLAEAREAAVAARKLKALGKDPIAERRSQRVQEKLEAARSISFEDCARAYIDAHKPGWKNAKHAAQWRSTLDTYVTPIFGSIPVQDVDVALVTKVLEPIWTTKTETASRIRGRIEAILDWAKAREYRQGENPARWKGHLDKLLPRRSDVQKVEHFAALPYREIGAFMAALKDRDGVGTLALQFLILTAARTKSVRLARWSQFDLVNNVWNAPAEIMKAGRAHRYPLSEAALAVLEKLPVNDRDGFLFPGLKPGRPISDGTMDRVCQKLMPEITVHGFRSSFRDWARECTNFPREVAEAALAHIVGDKVEAAYLRGDLFGKRRKLMNAWASFCSVAQVNSGVIGMNEHRQARA